MLNTLFSKTRRMVALAGIGLFAANCLMADVLPFPTRKRPRPIPMKANQSSQQPVRPYIQHMEPSKPKEPEPMTATMYGRLIYLGANATADANYALYRKDGEKMIPVCFFMWEGRGLEKYLDHDVKVTGFVKEKKGWTCPLLIFEYLENIGFLHTEEAKPQSPEPVFIPADQQSVPPPKPEAVKPLPPPQPAKPLPPPATAQPQPTFVQPSPVTAQPQSTFVPSPPATAQPQPTFVPPSKPVKVQPQPVVVPPPFPNPVPKRQPQPVVVPPPFPNPSSAKPLPPPEPIMPPPAAVEPPLPSAEPVKPLPPPAAVEPPAEIIKPQPKPATLELLLPPEAVKPQPKPATIEPLLPSAESAKPLPPPEDIEMLPPPDAGKTFAPRKAKPYRPIPPAKQFHR